MNDNYLNLIGRQPLLTIDEEIECGRRVQAMMPLLKKPPETLTRKEKRTIRAGQKAKERFVTGNMRMVAHIARRSENLVNHLTFHDLCQEGAIGLQRAAEKFDPARGYKFSTYAYWWIRQAIGRAISEKERSIRLPINIVESIGQVNKWKEKMEKETGQTPGYHECVTKSKLRPEVFRAALSPYAGIYSTDQRITNMPDGAALIDLIPDTKQMEKEDSTYFDAENEIRTIIAMLPEEQQFLLIKYYGLFGVPPVSLAELGKKRGVSREAVRQKVLRAELALKRKQNLYGTPLD